MKVTDIRCVIVLSEELGERFDGVFAGLSVARTGGGSELSGLLGDRAELQGVLRQLTDLGLNIVSLTTRPGESPEG